MPEGNYKRDKAVKTNRTVKVIRKAIREQIPINPQEKPGRKTDKDKR